MFLSGTRCGQQIANIIERTDTRAGKLFTYSIQGLIILSVISFSVETLPELTQWARKLLWRIEVITVLIFTAEYALRILVAKQKWRFIFSFYGVIDLLAILPFYVSHGLDLRMVRIFRLMRVFRVLKLTRYSNAIAHFRVAFALAKEEIILFSVLALMVLYLAAVGIYYFEHNAQPEQFSSVFDSLWWAVATLTTVGYGDIYPVTCGGKIFTFVVLMVGLGVVAVPAGMVASALSEARQRMKEEGSK